MSDPTEEQSPQREEPAPDAETYHITREGRRQAMILLVGVASLWVFALWTLITLFQDALSGVEWVSLLLMLAILLVAPLVAWALFEEANSRYIVTGETLRYKSFGGVDIAYKWSDLHAGPGPGTGRLARFFLGEDKEGAAKDASADAMDGEGDEEASLFRVPDRSDQIANPVARFLHKLAHGATLPVYGAVENRDKLLATIHAHTATSAVATDASPSVVASG
jgi:hypothetical protein